MCSNSNIFCSLSRQVWSTLFLSQIRYVRSATDVALILNSIYNTLRVPVRVWRHSFVRYLDQSNSWQIFGYSSTVSRHSHGQLIVQCKALLVYIFHIFRVCVSSVCDRKYTEQQIWKNAIYSKCLLFSFKVCIICTGTNCIHLACHKCVFSFWI